MHLLPLLALLAAPPADERVYALTRDGQKVGTCIIKVETAGDGTETATVTTRVGEGPTSYTYRGTETWRAGRVVAVAAETTDGGKTARVTVRAGPDGASVATDAKTVAVRGDPWPTTFWRLPDPKLGPEFTLVDPATGAVMQGKAEKVGPEKVDVGGKLVPATRWRVAGHGDLWFGDDGRLVRRAWTDGGRKLVLGFEKRVSE